MAIFKKEKECKTFLFYFISNKLVQKPLKIIKKIIEIYIPG